MSNEGTRNRVVTALAIVAGLGMFPLYSGCMTLEQMAPPVGGEFRMIAARHSVEVTTLELGREIYISDCARCHSVEPIGRYSAQHWRNILPTMAEKTLLNKRSAEAVESYVTLALVLLGEGWKADSEVAASRERLPDEGAFDTYAASKSRQVEGQLEPVRDPIFDLVAEIESVIVSVGFFGGLPSHPLLVLPHPFRHGERFVRVGETTRVRPYVRRHRAQAKHGNNVVNPSYSHVFSFLSRSATVTKPSCLFWEQPASTRLSIFPSSTLPPVVGSQEPARPHPRLPHPHPPPAVTDRHILRPA